MAQKNKATEQDSPLRQEKKSNKNQIFTFFIIFVVGFLSGIAFTVYKGSPPGGTAPTAASDGQTQNSESSQAILDMEAEVTANPENFESWIRLGHLYYDANQPEKAIAAYTKSLELHSGDANLLTDLGVMYRRTKQPEKAIELFDQAIKKDPSHLPSRFNKGIVLMYDLNDPQGAIASWEELLVIDPEAKAANGQHIHDFVDKIKAELAAKK
jgi:cytochrome c-type biogenesis protein CcmH/NrfG